MCEIVSKHKKDNLPRKFVDFMEIMINCSENQIDPSNEQIKKLKIKKIQQEPKIQK